MLSNPRHELFAQGLAGGLSASEAYKSAGFAGHASSASRLLTNAKIKDRVAELQERAAKGVSIDRQWVLERLIENANRAMQAEARLDESGAAVGEYKYDGSVANRALELIGKELGMFVERTENLNVHRDITDEPLSEDEWAERSGATH